MAKELINQIFDEQALQKQFDRILAGLSAVLDKMDLIQKSTIDITKQFGDAKTIQEIETATKKYQETIKKLEKQTELVKKKTDDLTIAERQLAQAKREKNKQAELEAKATNQQISAYDRLDAQLTILRRQYKDLAAAGKGETEQAKNLEKQITELDTTLKNLDKTTGQSQRYVGEYERANISLRQEMKNLSIQITEAKLRGEENTEEVIKAKQRLGELKDAMADTANEARILGSDTAKLDMAIGVFKGIASAAQVTEASMQLLGNENEDIQRGIQKLVAIQSLMNGVQEIGNALQKESAFMMGLVAAKTKVVAAAQWLWNQAQKANPAVLILTLTASLIAAFGLLAKALSKVTKEQIDLNKANEDAIKITQQRTKEAEKQAGIDEAIGAKRLLTLQRYSDAARDNYWTERQLQIEFIKNRVRLAKDEGDIQNEQERMRFESYQRMQQFSKQYFDYQQQLQEESIRQGIEQEERLAKIVALKADNRNKKIINLEGKKITKLKQVGEIELKSSIERDQAALDAKNRIIEMELEAERRKHDLLMELQVSLYNTVLSLGNSVYERQLNRIDALSRKDEEAKEKELSRKNLTDAQKDAIERKYDNLAKKRERERIELQIKQAKFNKLVSALNIGLNTAEAITKVTAQFGALPIVPGLIAIVSAIGALQLASVLAQPIPKYAKGRKGGKQELALVGEAGTEAIVHNGKSEIVDRPTLTVLPAGADVISNKELQSMEMRNYLRSPKYFDTSKEKENYLLSKQIKSIDELTRKLSDLKQIEINVDGNGINVWSAKGKSYVKYIDKKFRS